MSRHGGSLDACSDEDGHNLQGQGNHQPAHPGSTSSVVPGQWVDRESYRFKAPGAEQAAEAERIRQGDDAALAALRAQKRAGLVPCNEQLGGSHASMRQARLAFVDKLQRESSPSFIRRKRTEEEKKKKAEERERHEQEKRHRAAEWAERERRKLAKNRADNKAKQRHWESWGDQQNRIVSNHLGIHSCAAGGSNGGSDASACDASGRGDITMVDGRDTHVSELTSATSATSAAGQLANPASTTYPDDVECNTLTLEPSGLCAAPSASVLCVICDASVVPGSGSYDLGVCICSSCALSQSLIVSGGPWQCPVCTLINEPNALQCSVCENQRPQSQVPPPQAASAAPQASAPASGCAPAPHLAASHNLLAWLQQNRLQEYYEALIEHGYDNRKDMEDMEPDEVDEMFTYAKVKPGHKARFKRALKGHCEGGSGNHRECPVCLTGQDEKVDTALTPCGHVFCAEHAGQAKENAFCPVCRSKVASLQRIYL